MKKCPVCATESSDEAAFCIRCGTALASVTTAAAPASGQHASPVQPVPTAVVGTAGWPLPSHAASQAALGGAAPREKSNVLLLVLVGGGALLVFVLIVAAIAIPNLLRSKMAANEAVSVGSLRTLNTACVTYSTQYGGYPPSLGALGGEGSGAAPSATSAQLIDNVLQTGTKSGYNFTYSAGPIDNTGVIASYAINANPVVPGTTGVRYFFTDQSGVIRAESGRPANADSPPLE